MPTSSIIIWTFIALEKRLVNQAKSTSDLKTNGASWCSWGWFESRSVCRSQGNSTLVSLFNGKSCTDQQIWSSLIYALFFKFVSGFVGWRLKSLDQITTNKINVLLSTMNVLPDFRWNVLWSHTIKTLTVHLEQQKNLPKKLLCKTSGKKSEKKPE